MEKSTAETVEGPTLSLESVNDVHGGDGLPLGVFRVRDGIADDVLQEDFEHTARLLVDETRNALDAATPGQSTDGGFGDALDVVAQHFAVPFSSSFAQSFASFAATSHFLSDWILSL